MFTSSTIFNMKKFFDISIYPKTINTNLIDKRVKGGLDAKDGR